MSENIGTLYITQIPSLTDSADIQSAFKLYHYGTTSTPTDTANLIANSVAGNLHRLDTTSVFISGTQTITGAKTFSAALSATSTLTVDGTLTTNGNTVIGNNSTDTLTVNATPTFAANTIFNGNLTANGNTIIGTAAGADTLTVNAITNFVAATTAVTQTAGDSTTKLATTAFASTGVDNSVKHWFGDGSDGTLVLGMVMSASNNTTITLTTGTTAYLQVGMTVASIWSNGTGLSSTTIASITNSTTFVVTSNSAPISSGAVLYAHNMSSPPGTFIIQSSGSGTGLFALGRDAFFQNLVLYGSTTNCRLYPGGYRIHVAGTFDVASAVSGVVYSAGTAGSAGSGTIAGAAGTTSGAILGGLAGTAGGAGVGTTAAGNAGVSLANTTSVFPSSVYLGASGGTGGISNTGAAGGSGGTHTSPTNTFGWHRAWFDWTPLVAGKLMTSAGGTGGGSGGGGTSGTGGAGGGGGAGCQGISIYANTINRGSGTGTGFISSTGGSGGAGAAGTGGGGHGHGGGGGQGGFVYILYGKLTGTSKANAITSAGGSGGSYGGSGGGTPGSTGGASGAILLLNITNGSFSYTAPVAGTTGTATSAGTGRSTSVTL